MKEEEGHAFAKGEFYGFEAGEAVICRQDEGFVHGRIRMLAEGDAGPAE